MALVNELVAKHSSRGNVLRSNAKQLAQFAVGHSRSVAGNVCCAASLCIPGKATAGLVPAVLVWATPGKASSCVGKEAAVVTPARLGCAAAETGARGVPWATWMKATKAAAMAKNMV